MNIQEIREKYPTYNDLSDTELAQKLHQKFYSDIPFQDFAAKVGIQQQTFTGQIPEGTDVRDFSVNPEAVQNPEVPAGPANVHERLFGKPGTKLLPGAEPLKWAAENPEVVASTAASLLAPEISIPAQAAAKLGPLLTQFVAQTAARVPAAFMGGAGGNLVGQMTGVKKVDPNAEISDIILDNLKAGGRMAAAETTGAMLSPVVSKIFAPGASSMTAQSREIADFAKQRNIPTAPSTLSPNVTAKATEGVTDAFFPSRLVNDAYRKKAVVRFNQLMTEIPEEVGEIQGNKVITPKAMEEIGSLLKASKMAGKELSEEFLETIGPQTPVKVSNTKAMLSKVNKTATDSALREWAEVKSGQLKGKVTAEDLETALRQVGGVLERDIGIKLLV